MNLYSLKEEESLAQITDLREQETVLINQKAAEIEIDQAINVYLEENIINLHTKRAKTLDLNQFSQYLRMNDINFLADLARLSNIRLEKLCAAFLEERLKIGNQVVSVQRKKISVRCFLRYLSDNFNRLLPYVPVIDNSKFKFHRHKGVTEGLTKDEWLRLKDQLVSSKNKELLALVYFAVMAGGRRISECQTVKWRDIDFERNRIKIIPSKSKTLDFEYLPLHAGLKEILSDLFEQKKRPGQKELIFSTKQQSADRSLKHYANKTNINKKISFHSLRTTFITWGLERGDTPSELLNATLHNSTNMLRYYDRTDTLITSSIHNTKA
jgi:integrase